MLKKKFGFVFLVCFVIFHSCKSDDSSGGSSVLDTDGDGVFDDQENFDGTNKNDPCDPVQNEGYFGFDPKNAIWREADCDNDGFKNGDEADNGTKPYLDDIVYSTPQFLPQLSELNVFEGDLADLAFNNSSHEYILTTSRFKDYAYSVRSISLPRESPMIYNGDELFIFPDKTVITITYYYLNDDRTPSLGRKIIETQVLIKTNGVWNLANYIWNDEQSEAFLNEASSISIVTVEYIDPAGVQQNFDYEINTSTSCIQCHNINGATRPLGTKPRNLNRVRNGRNQIDHFTNRELLQGAPGSDQIARLPPWLDGSFSLEDRARAYIEMNCAHCHQPGGLYQGALDLRFETPFADTNIQGFKGDIVNRINKLPEDETSMPKAGIILIHPEGVALIEEYIESLN
ncbi:hypothetical protein MNBD_BACTEROID03-959 [hydrothermal vent metagenome]|uniref:Cytochrome c domain-containing protein n=2 Tax=hydrothermal vent metagenome TaxID=652676 RepID=A0A3B0SXG7_9ZZZZ